MNGDARECLLQRDRCLELAQAAPTEEIRASLRKLARLYEKEAVLIANSEWRISASRELLASVDQILGDTKGGVS